MATKTKKAPAAETTRGEFPNAIELSLKSCVFNAEVNVRTLERDSDKIEQIATSMIERREAGKYHQIQPAVVRPIEGDKYEILDGGYRYMACKAATDASKEDFPLWAVIVQRGEDVEALVESLQAAAFRTELSPFERAESIARLVALGKTQTEVAAILCTSEATVSQGMKLAKVDSKVRKMVEAGDLEADAAIVVAGLPVDDTKRQEILEEAIRHRSKIEDVTAAIANRAAKAEIDARAEKARKNVEEAKILAKDSAEKRKEIEKAKDELVKTAAKTKDVGEMVELRKQVEAKEAEAARLAEQEKQAIAAKEKAAHELEKTRREKENLKPKPAANVKTGPEDVKRAAKAKGVDAGKAPVSRKDFIATVEALASDTENPLPKSAVELIGKMEQFLEGEYTDRSLRQMFLLCCRDDSEYERARVARKRK